MWYAQARSDAANPKNGDAFEHDFVARQPHTDAGWRQKWEKHSDGLMDLYESVRSSSTCHAWELALYLGFTLFGFHWCLEGFSISLQSLVLMDISHVNATNMSPSIRAYTASWNLHGCMGLRRAASVLILYTVQHQEQ